MCLLLLLLLMMMLLRLVVLGVLPQNQYFSYFGGTALLQRLQALPGSLLVGAQRVAEPRLALTNHPAGLGPALWQTLLVV